MTEQHECEWFITSDLGTGAEEVLCNIGDCAKVLSIEEADRRLNEYETLKSRPSIKISDGDVWLVFPNAIISIEGLCKFGAPGPIVKKNLRKWRDDILEGKP